MTTIKNDSASVQSLDQSIDALLETIGYESSEQREPEKEFIHLIVASYRTGDTLQEQKSSGKRRQRRLSKFRVRDLTVVPSEEVSATQKKMKRLFEQMKLGCFWSF